jgi:ATP adenylyltransferase
MEHLWAPWRIEYIKESQSSKLKTQKPGCFLCVKDKTNINKFVLFRGKYAFIMMNRYPYNPGHLMIAPYRHIGLIEKCHEQETNEMFKLLQKSVVALKNLMKPEGFNVGINLGLVGGAGVPGHIHIHVVPRWLGDTNFMPIISSTKVINEELTNMYNKLKKVLNSNGKN